MKHEFPSDHDNPTNSQLLLAVTGTPKYIREKLEQLLNQMNDPYGKPRQGTEIGYDGYCSVITPVWKGEKY